MRLLQQCGFVLLTIVVGMMIGWRAAALYWALIWLLLLGVSAAAVGVSRARLTSSVLSGINSAAQYGVISLMAFVLSVFVGSFGQLD